MGGDEPVAGRHGLRRAEGGGGARDRARLRGSADASRSSGRRHLRQLPRGQPGAVEAHRASARRQDRRSDRGGAGGLVAWARPQARRRPGDGAGRGPRAPLGAGLGGGFPEPRGETGDARLRRRRGGGMNEKRNAGAAAVGSSMVALLLAQAEAQGADLVTLRGLIEEASELGAERALGALGLRDEGARRDMDELRELLQAWRDAKKSALQAVVAWFVRILLALLVIGMAVKLHLWDVVR